MTTNLHERHVSWLEGRALDPVLAERLGLFTKREGDRLWIGVPYVEHGKVINHKWRVATEKRHRMDTGAPLTLWNHDVLLADQVQSGQQPIIICEGEWDAIAAIQSGFEFVVSVPNGAPETETEVNDPENDAERYRFIWRSRALLDKVGTFILAVDADAAGQALRADLARRLGPERCQFVAYPDGCKDLNEVLKLHNEMEVARTLNAARPYPIKGVYKLADFPDPPPLRPISMGLPACDTALPLLMATLTVWTGFAGAGKTSLLMFLIANLLRSGINVALGSFETMPKPILDRKLREALCRSYHDYIPADQLAWANDLLHKRFTVVAQASDDPDHELTLEETLELARVTVLRDGAQLFIIDPWNELEHKRRPDESELGYTARAIRAWKAFARTYNCAVWIVAHPKKPVEFGKVGEAPGLYHVSGSSDWANKADYGVVVHRPDKTKTITEMTISKVRMGLPGEERTIKLDWQWRTASYADAGNTDD